MKTLINSARTLLLVAAMVAIALGGASMSVAAPDKDCTNCPGGPFYCSGPSGDHCGWPAAKAPTE